jgi:hypothetical protein
MAILEFNVSPTYGDLSVMACCGSKQALGGIIPAS